MTGILNRAALAAAVSTTLLMSGISANADSSGHTSGPAAGSTAAPGGATSNKAGHDHPTAENGASVGSPGTAGAPGNKNGPPAKKPH